jgi:hypothetical protein
MQPNIMFDNFYLGHSVDEAEKFMRETFMKKKVAEPASKKETLKKRVMFISNSLQGSHHLNWKTNGRI